MRFPRLMPPASRRIVRGAPAAPPGFTLIELLIVVAIIVILVALITLIRFFIVVFKFKSFIFAGINIFQLIFINSYTKCLFN